MIARTFGMSGHREAAVSSGFACGPSGSAPSIKLEQLAQIFGFRERGPPPADINSPQHTQTRGFIRKTPSFPGITKARFYAFVK